MAKTKSYPDINQCKKLAEILPPESADMHYVLIDTNKNKYSAGLGKYIGILPHYPCWSLAALLEIIRKTTAVDLLIDGRGFRCHCRDKREGKFYGTEDYCDTPISACIEVILKLHKQKLL